MFWQSRSKHASPERVESDTVIPFHFMDDTMVKGVVMNWSFRFDDVLDAEKLRTGLESLMEMGEWRKLGARVRQNDGGRLEYHVPAKFDRILRPSLMYRHTEFDSSVDEHPIAGRLPRATGIPHVYEAPADEMERLVAPEGMPQGIEFWLQSDSPLLGLHIITFTDASIVSMTWSHAVMDGRALRDLFTAWTLVIEGRPAHVPTLAGYSEDPILPLTKLTPPSTYYLYNQCLTVLGMVVFVFNFLVESIMHPKLETRNMCLPKHFVDNIKEEASASIGLRNGEKPFIRDGDIIMAWWTQVAVRALGVSPTRPINIMNPVDIRGFASRSIPETSVFMGNAVEPSLTFLPAETLLQQSVGTTADRIHQDLVKLRTPLQIQARVSLSHSKGGMVLVGPPNQLMMSHSNMHKFRFFEVDFSAAVVRPGKAEADRQNKPGQPSFANLIYASKTMKLRNVGPILGRDAAGNWWLSWTMRKSAWPKVAELFAKLHPSTSTNGLS